MRHWLHVRDWPLRLKVAVVLVLMSSAPVAIIAITNVRESRLQIFQDETALLGARAEQLARELDRFNHGYLRAASRLSGVPEVVDFLASPPVRDDDPRTRGLASRLAVHLDHDPAVRGIGLIDRTGRVRAGTEPNVIGRDRGFRRYFRDGLDGRGRISDPYLAEGGVLTIAYVSPVRAADGAVLGLLVFWVRTEAMWAVARDANGLAGAGSYAVIYDADGVRIAHTHRPGLVFRPGGPLPQDVVDRSVAERRFGAGTLELLHDVQPFPDQFDRARAAELDANVFHAEAPVSAMLMYGVARRMSSVGWTVFYMVPDATLTAPITALTKQRVIASVATALIALVIGVLISTMLLRPIRRLARATQALARGELATRIDDVRGDELGQLGQAFNTMARQLEERAGEVELAHDALEGEVKQRTAELVEANRGLREREQRLEASEQRYRDLYEHAPDMHLSADVASTLIVEVNQTLCERLGFTKAELIGRPFLDVYHPDNVIDRTATERVFQATGQVVDAERLLRHKDGSPIEASLNVRGVRDASGAIVGVRAVWRDITKRKQSDRDRQLLLQLGELLRVSTDQADLLATVARVVGQYLRASRCMFIEIDEAGDTVTVFRDYHDGVPSAAGAKPLAMFSAEAVAECKTGRVVSHDDTATDPRTAATYEAAYRPASVRASVTVPMMRDGRWVAALVVTAAEPRPWEERELALLVLVAERVWLWIEHLRVLADLHDREVADAVQHSEERFRRLVENVRDYAIFMLDPDGRVATWNAGAERLLGYTEDEILGAEISKFAQVDREPGEEVREPASELATARETGRYEGEGWRVCKDGSRFWANVLLTTVYDRDGSIEGFAKVTRDFTDRRKQDEELAAREVALVASLKEREVLLQEVHHRVKNNLQVISSLIHMQARKLERGSSRDALEECQTRVLAIALIHEKLYQSKDYSKVRFAEYARSLAANVFHATGMSPQLVSLELAIAEIPLSVDRAIPCGLVINELITNSLKHAFPDSRRGTIRVELARVGTGQLELAVSDNGVGLPPGFDIAKTKSMGLQLVSTLADQLRATLTIESRHGARFQLVFAV